MRSSRLEYGPSSPSENSLGLLVLTTGVLWAGGWWMRGGHNPVRHRLVTVLWFLSAGGMGWLADVAANDLWDIEDGYALIIGLTLSLYAGLLYLHRRTSLQQIAVAGGVVFLCGGLSDIVGGNDWFGLLLWAAGVAWIALARIGVLTPLVQALRWVPSARWRAPRRLVAGIALLLVALVTVRLKDRV